MMTIDPKAIPVPKMHSYLLGAVVPRPIALASTIDTDGHVNLSPFSFFNVFSANPPILVFSPARRGRDNTTKHTYENVKAVPEVVINIVNYRIVEQVSLASCEYPREVNEYVKAGLTPLASEVVKPPRVAESPVQFECKVNQVIELGSGGAAGNLVICEVLRMHIDPAVLDVQGRIDPFKLDAVARMGADYYLRAQGEGVFTVPKPNEKLGIGIDELPERIRKSAVLTGNQLAKLANVERIPDEDGRTAFTREVKEAKESGEAAMHTLAQQALNQGDVTRAWQILLVSLK
ncbi:MAG: flavin reductase family protein [Cyclobacteriaceae bacterium]|nr:flavin reductase family protein [Cyclobacteriaceae bacterium]